MKRLIPLAILALLAHGPAFGQGLELEPADDLDDFFDEPHAEATAEAAPPPSPNRLIATDGSELPGTLTEWVAGAAGEAPDLLWLATPPSEPLRLNLSNVLELRQDVPLAGQGERYALLSLNNRDSLRGELIALDEEHVTLRTHFAGDLKFRRDMIESLHIVHQPASLYSGPKRGDFTLSPGLSQEGDSLIGKSGRAVTLFAYPERFRLAMDIEWGFIIAFLADDDAGPSRSGYELYCYGDSIGMRKRGGMSLGDDDNEISDFSDKEKVRLELLVDTRSGLILLLIDGRMIGEWNDPTPVKPDSANVFAVAMASGAQVRRVSSITLANWDGNRNAINAENPSKDGESLNKNANNLLLRNGDVVQADQVAVTDGRIAAKTPNGDILIPLSRASLVSLKKPAGNPPTPKKRSGDVRGWLPDGSRLTFRFDDLKDGKISASSQMFGAAEFDLKAFERIEMNLDNLDLEHKRPRLHR